MKECPFESCRNCDIWIDYQISCNSLREAEELCSSKWEEINYLLNRVNLLESLLTTAEIEIPK